MYLCVISVVKVGIGGRTSNYVTGELLLDLSVCLFVYLSVCQTCALRQNEIIVC